MDYDIKKILEKDAKANGISKGITPPVFGSISNYYEKSRIC